ncbi:Uncharacterised protein [Chryseobacterium indoltheticum]|uniref:Uncharacterized protein n=1 Tax=Chryseobacterium indoltheticum TaxID=254 RepID=A0A381FF21_9FLAO|nr:Uncharacterised protein [Chryseobacterium indoltheticum]
MVFLQKPTRSDDYQALNLSQAPSVRVFFVAQRRKKYGEPVNGSTNFVCESKTSRYGFFQNLLEVTFVESKLLNTIDHANIIRLHITLFR